MRRSQDRTNQDEDDLARSLEQVGLPFLLAVPLIFYLYPVRITRIVLIGTVAVK